MLSLGADSKDQSNHKAVWSGGLNTSSIRQVRSNSRTISLRSQLSVTRSAMEIPHCTAKIGTRWFTQDHRTPITATLLAFLTTVWTTAVALRRLRRVCG